MPKIIKWLKSPWGISIGTAFFSFLLLIAYDLFKDKPFFSTIETIFKAILNFTILTLNFELKIWWILLGIAIMFIVYFLLKKQSQKMMTTDPKFIVYTKDKINGWNWEWLWEKDYYENWDIAGLHLICPICDTPLVKSYGYSDQIKCVKCNQDFYESLPDFDIIKMLIFDNVKKNPNFRIDFLKNTKNI